MDEDQLFLRPAAPPPPADLDAIQDNLVLVHRQARSVLSRARLGIFSVTFFFSALLFLGLYLIGAVS
jgi:hypothetical protein